MTINTTTCIIRLGLEPGKTGVYYHGNCCIIEVPQYNMCIKLCFQLHQKFVKMDWTNQTNVDDFVVKTETSTVRHDCFGNNLVSFCSYAWVDVI